MKVTIIGAGISGLTTAIALQQKGFEIELFEAAPVFKKAGAGINLAINAMQVYKRLGLYEAIVEKGSCTHSMRVLTKKMKELSKIDLREIATEFSTQTVAIHRAALHDILIGKLGNASIQMNKKVKTAENLSDGVALTFEDGTTHHASLVVGADGIHSALRQSIFDGTQTRNAHQICWRGITKTSVATAFKNELNELWGKGKRFGFVHINKDEVYWFALKNTKKEEHIRWEGADIAHFFSDFHPVVSELIKSTPAAHILTNGILDLMPINTWYKGNVCLVGDAAHATTPNMGQGACQAIESALAFSICLAAESNPQKAFQRYQNIRKKKAVQVVKTSWGIGKIAQTDNRILAGIRNTILPIIPSRINKKQSKALFSLAF